MVYGSRSRLRSEKCVKQNFIDTQIFTIILNITIQSGLRSCLACRRSLLLSHSVLYDLNGLNTPSTCTDI